jgi:ElaB/YqjD/DUF883 family membrane-anchored ribosome-binding protein
METVSTEKLFTDLKAVVQDAEELLRATAGQAGEKVAAARERAQESVRLAKERMAELQDDLVERTRELADGADTYVRENPWQAVGIAAAAGLVLGLMIRRR